MRLLLKNWDLCLLSASLLVSGSLCSACVSTGVAGHAVSNTLIYAANPVWPNTRDASFAWSVTWKAPGGGATGDMTPLYWSMAIEHECCGMTAPGQLYPSVSQPSFTIDASGYNGTAKCATDYVINGQSSGIISNVIPYPAPAGEKYRGHHWVAWGAKNLGGIYPLNQRSDKATFWSVP